jgi:hypothetical protein
MKVLKVRVVVIKGVVSRGEIRRIRVRIIVLRSERYRCGHSGDSRSTRRDDIRLSNGWRSRD